MQTKNVNLNQDVEGKQNLNSQEAPVSSTSQPPPLPPRLSQLKAHQNGDCGGGGQGPPAPKPPLAPSNDPNLYSAYKPVPTPRPVPPPYRMPPIPSINMPGYHKYGSEPLLPGTMAPETLNLHMYSSKYPPPLRREVDLSQQTWTDKAPDSTASRIPSLAELSRGQRPRSAHGAIGPDPGVPTRSQAWVDDKQTPGGRPDVPVQQRLRTLLSHSPVEHNHNEQDKANKKTLRQLKFESLLLQGLEGEPLLPSTRRAVSYPEGISNPALDDGEGYVPSQPHQRPEGPRGQVLLERPPPKTPLLDSNPNLYRPQSSSTETAETSLGGLNSELPVARSEREKARIEDQHGDDSIPTGLQQWSSGTLSEDGHTNHLRDACSRFYPRGPRTPQSRGPNDNGSKEDHQGTAEANQDYGGSSQPTGDALPGSPGKKYYYLCDVISGGRGKSQEIPTGPNHSYEENTPSQGIDGDFYGRQQQSRVGYHVINMEGSDKKSKESVYGRIGDAKQTGYNNPYGERKDETVYSRQSQDRIAEYGAKYSGKQESVPVYGSHQSGGSSDYEKNTQLSGQSTTNTSSESGRGTMHTGTHSSSTKSGSLDTSLESDINVSHPHPSSSSHKGTNRNAGDWGDLVDKELHHILQATAKAGLLGGPSRNLDSTVSDSMSVTPPLPPLSPTHSHSDSADSPKLISKYKLSQSTTALNKHGSITPDMLDAAGSHNKSSSKKFNPRRPSSITPEPARPWSSRRTTPKGQQAKTSGSNQPRSTQSRVPLMLGPSLSNIHEAADGEVTSTTTGLDMESLLDDGSVSSGTTDEVSSQTSDIHDLRRQLESLENMYSEVLKLLGVKSRSGLGSQRTLVDLRPKKKVYGSLSSLTGKGYSSSTSRGHIFKDRRNPSEKRKQREKGVSRRFQRLESHVVTLARSVAHLSSEMRTQHIMFQEIEGLRREVGQIREQQLALRLNAAPNSTSGARNNKGATSEWDNFRSSVPSLTNPVRVKKLTKFFGDEPPLLRLFLKKLGYEKYASNFEAEKIGMIELPYLTEERLQKIGIPMGPRMRILQEAQMSFRQEHFNIYIV